MGLVEDDVGVDVDDGDVDAERVGVTVGVLDLGLGWSGRGWGRLLGVLLFLEDDGAVVGCGTLVFVGGRGGGFLLSRGWSGLGVSDAAQGKKKDAGGQKKEAGRTVSVGWSSSRTLLRMRDGLSGYWTAVRAES